MVNFGFGKNNVKHRKVLGLAALPAITTAPERCGFGQLAAFCWYLPMSSTVSKQTQIALYIVFAILMMALGSSDSLRGVFAPIFEEHFTLSASDLSLIITVSYVGNLVFMLLGTRISDAFGLRMVFIATMLLWMAALALYLLTDNFILLLGGMFFAMGASTLLNIMLNLMSPFLFAAPGMILNTLFFTQGIGTTFTQSVISSSVDSFVDWKLVNGTLLVMGAVAVLAFAFLSRGIKGLNRDHLNGSNAPTDTAGSDATSGSAPKVRYSEILRAPAFWFFFLCFGCYFVGEHGIMNWMNIYLIRGQNFTAADAAVFPALFFGGMTLGRLLLSKLVDKAGIMRSLRLCFISGTVIYVIAFVFGGNAYYLFALAGFMLSIIYPTMMLSVQLYFPAYNAATATGVIMSVATIFDIVFNAVFGYVIEAVGYDISMSLMPIAMVLATVIFLVFERMRSLRLKEDLGK